MSEGSQKEPGKPGRKKNEDKFKKILPSAYIDEKIGDDNTIGDGNAIAQTGSENDIPALYLGENETVPEGETTSLETLLAAWWDYKRANKLKKKKKKALKIYRDENYWSQDRFTDDEDFNFSGP